MSTKRDVAYRFADFFSKRREELNIGVRELGKNADVSYTVIYDLEKRGVLPKIETLIKLARALEFTVSCDREKESLQLKIGVFRKNSNKRVSITDVIFKRSDPEISTDESLKIILSQKGLNPDEVREVLNFINYQLSKKKG